MLCGLDVYLENLGCLFTGRCRRRRRFSSHSSIEMSDLEKDVRILKKTWKMPPSKLTRSLDIRRNLILQSIKLDYTRIIFIWSCSSKFPIESAVHTLSTYGVVTNVYYRRPVCETNALNMQCGALVEFARRTDAEKASIEFPSVNKNLKLVVLSSLIHHIANFEVLYPRSETATKIRIRKKGFLEADDVKKLHQKLYQKLNTYGSIRFLMFENTPEKTELVCEVKYFCLTHAFLAMIMTNGEIVTDNVLSCELHRKEKQDNILQAVKTYETLVLGKNFPW